MRLDSLGVVLFFLFAVEIDPITGQTYRFSVSSRSFYDVERRLSFVLVVFCAVLRPLVLAQCRLVPFSFRFLFFSFFSHYAVGSCWVGRSRSFLFVLRVGVVFRVVDLLSRLWGAAVRHFLFALDFCGPTAIFIDCSDDENIHHLPGSSTRSARHFFSNNNNNNNRKMCFFCI